MAIQAPGDTQEITDPLIQRIGNCLNNRRRQLWMWFYLEKHYRAGYKKEETDSPEMSELICKFADSRYIDIGALSNLSLKYTLTNKQLEWIIDDPRLCNWLCTRLCEKMGLSFHFYQGLTWRENTIALLDGWEINLDEKAAELRQWQFEWSDQLALDKKLGWFNKVKEKELERCAFAWDWLVKSDQYDTTNIAAPKSAQDLICFFNGVNLINAKKIISIDIIRKNWTQRAYREKQGDKKQYNFILTNLAIKRLDKLCSNHGLTRAQTLEMLLQTERENDLYIKEKLQIYKNFGLIPIKPEAAP